MRETLLRLLAPSPTPLDPQTANRLAHLADWGAFCAMLGQCGLAALAYQRLVSVGTVLPEHVAGWLRAQYEHTARRNLFLLQELHSITAQLLGHGIPTLVLKGPVLAHIGVGALVRTYHDLDVLVPRCHITRAAEVLRTLGFVELPEEHGFHQVSVRMRQAPDPSIRVELHFNLSDNGHPYAPDVAGVWARSVNIELDGHVVRVPELTDHLLITIMQLPHHYFDPRLLLDIAHIVDAHGAGINWGELIQRAQAWEMRALVGSTLYNIESFFQVPLPAAASAYAEPESYVQRVQWRIARQAALDRLSPLAAGKIGHVAPFLVVDRLRATQYLVRHNVLRTWGRDRRGDQVAAAVFTRIGAGLSTLPSLMWVAGSATMRTKHRDSSSRNSPLKC